MRSLILSLIVILIDIRSNPHLIFCLLLTKLHLNDFRFCRDNLGPFADHRSCLKWLFLVGIIIIGSFLVFGITAILMIMHSRV